MQAKPGKVRQAKEKKERGGGESKNLTFNSCPANSNFESSKESFESIELHDINVRMFPSVPIRSSNLCAT